jgi:hypothetical protein
MEQAMASSLARSVVGLLLVLACAGRAGAEVPPDDPRRELQQEIGRHIPPDWTVHASWRGSTLVGFVAPPIQQSFELLYEPDKQIEVLRGLCRQLTPAMWHKVGADNAIALEPVISGKGSIGMRVGCVRAD